MYFFFFFKQKTAYEMRISDWSSDVCSSDLIGARKNVVQYEIDSGIGDLEMFHMVLGMLAHLLDAGLPVRAVRQCRVDLLGGVQIGRASCRERVCQYV